MSFIEAHRLVVTIWSFLYKSLKVILGAQLTLAPQELPSVRSPLICTQSSLDVVLSTYALWMLSRPEHSWHGLKVEGFSLKH